MPTQVIPVRRLAAFVALVLALVLSPAFAQQSGTDPGRSLQWGIEKVRAPQAWPVGTGEGTVIAIVDTGVDIAHEDLASQVVAGRDFVNDDDDPSDRNGHGTHVAGIAAAATGNNRGVAGVAPGARIMPIRVLDENGNGFSDDVLAGVKWAVDRGADVVNLSLGVTGAQLVGNALDDAVDYAWSRGAIPVVAAGNDYVLSSGFADEPALVVSATTRHDTKPDYSNGVGTARWGIAAPGGGTENGIKRDEDDVLSTWWNGQEPNLYAYQQGTSMSAPHVAGAAAILVGLGLQPQQVVDRLLSTATDIGPPGVDRTFGHGRLDVAKAVEGLGRARPAGSQPPATTVRPTAPPAPAPTRPTPTAAPSTTSTTGPRAFTIPTLDDDRDTDSASFDAAPRDPGGGSSGPSTGLLLLAGWLLVTSGGTTALFARRVA